MRVNLEGKIFSEWTVLKELGGGKVLAKCSCGKEKELYKKTLLEGKTKSCGCKKSEFLHNNQTENLDGQKFGEWTVIKDTKRHYVLCRCSCGTEREVLKQALKDGRTKSCGHAFFKDDITGRKFGEWEVLDDYNNGTVLVKCSCGLIKENRKHSIVHGISKSCGHSEKLEGQKFGEWEVIADLENDRKKLCRCSCGTIRKIHPTLLKTGHTKSCGCKANEYSKETMLMRYGDIASSKIYEPREDWQIEIINNKDMMLEYINKLGYKPTIYDLENLLNLSKSRVKDIIHQLGLDEYIEWKPTKSGPEKEIAKYLEEVLGYELVTSDRQMIKPYELDIYIPEIRTAVEFNGNYWHSAERKDIEYHQRKSLMALHNKIRLIHIYEYEWNENSKAVLANLYNMLNSNINADDSDGEITLSLDKDNVIAYIENGYTIKNICEPNKIVTNSNNIIYDAGKITLRKEVRKNG